MPRAKSNSIESMGLQPFLDEYYGTKGGHKRFIELLTDGKPDSEIAKAFSTDNRKLNYQTVGGWRKRYLMEKAK